jgi:hypothetical protein
MHLKEHLAAPWMDPRSSILRLPAPVRLNTCMVSRLSGFKGLHLAQRPHDNFDAAVEGTPDFSGVVGHRTIRPVAG